MLRVDVFWNRLGNQYDLFQVFNKQLFYLNTAIETQEIYITRGLDTSKEE